MPQTPITVIFFRERETRWFVRFKRDWESQGLVMGALYVRKEWVQGSDEISVILTKGDRWKPLARSARSGVSTSSPVTVSRNGGNARNRARR